MKQLPKLSLTILTAASFALSAFSAEDKALGFSGQALPPQQPLSLWYRKPANEWVEALPVGNGRLGAMVFGGTRNERIQFNESTLWVGEPRDYSRPGAANHLAAIRQLLFDGKQKDAEQLALREFMSVPLRQIPYQAFGDLLFQFPGHEAVANYRRDLNLDEGVTKTTYQVDDVRYDREIFVSHPDQVIAMRLTANQPGKVSFSVTFDCPHTNSAVKANGNELVLSGRARDSYNDVKFNNPLKFEARLQARADGGQTRIENGRIEVSNANSVVLVLAAATSFKNFQDVTGDPNKACVKVLENVKRRDWTRMVDAHVRDHQELFRRVTLDLGSTTSTLPTNERLQSAPKVSDPGLATLVFQYGRYLMIATSRAGGQPSTLQGVWNDSLKPPWDSKYTCNINTEMNYWPTEVANLAECHEPLFDALDELMISGRRTAKNHYNARGWVLHHNFDIWRGTAPINNPNHGIWVTGGAWLCQHLWWHYQFGQDRDFLKDRAYPIMKDAALFFVDFLTEDPRNDKHWLISTPGNSPEQGGLVAGPTMDHQIIRDLFSNVIEASQILGKDKELRAKLIELRARIAPNQIGKHGQLQEWLEDVDEPDNKHRHVSHLWGIYPGNDITWQTSELFKAAQQSLVFRGDEATGWSMGWKVNLWARFLDGDHANLILRNLLRPIKGGQGGGMYPNLFDAHPPFQIDGNFGATSGIAEMLVQSHIRDANDGYVIHLLPALPSAWPNGKITGLRARGGVTLDIAWQNGKLVSAKLQSPSSQTCSVRYGNKTIQTKIGKRTTEVTATSF